MDSDTRKKISQELWELSFEKLLACRNILEFNLNGVLVGDKEDTQTRLDMVNEEINRRAPYLRNTIKLLYTKSVD
jgi:hypothetical protein